MIRSVEDYGESILYALRSLYSQYGYSRYKMNKFEEYDLYARHKDFLVSDSVITFTDGTGKLLALKPDVTLSIVKNTRDDEGTKKLYYNENVYRVRKGSRNFGEIMQVGLECIGKIDEYSLYEVLSLASDSLDCISPSNVLSVSHLGILSEVMDFCRVPESKKPDVLRCIGEKNLHELSGVFAGIGDDKADIIRFLVRLSGKTSECLPQIKEKLTGVVSERTLDDFISVMQSLSGRENIKIDFSVIGDIHYYNGFVFKGFVEGIPSGILSGGQYDSLMKEMARSSGAVGFAVYLDTLEQFFGVREEYDIDTLLLYEDGTMLSCIAAEAEKIKKSGASVLAVSAIPDGVRYRNIIRVTKDGEINGQNA